MMATEEKKPEWKIIADASRRAEDERTAKLRAARLARDAQSPPPEPSKPKARKKKPA